MRDLLDRTKVTVAGAAIVEVDHAEVVATANRRAVRRLRRAGLHGRADGARAARSCAGPAAAPPTFPPADSAYHNYAEMAAEVGRHGGRDTRASSRASASASRTRAATIWAVKISDNVATDENEPEVLFTANQHAREHLTVEMALYILNQLTSIYGTDARITNIVNSREIWIVPMVNPDGVEYDIATGSYRMWRKNRQPNAGSSAVGTDLNRNWRSSGAAAAARPARFSSETYRGAVGVLGARDAARARLRQLARGRRRPADQGAHRLPHLLAS